MKSKNWFWGTFFVLAAIFVIASQTGAFGAIGVLSVAATVLLVALFIHSALNLNFFGMFLALALFYMVFWQPLGLLFISPWLLLLAAVLAGMGFSMIFRKHPHPGSNWNCHDCGCNEGTGLEHPDWQVENIDDNNPYAKVSFGGSSKYLHGDCLKTGRFIASFGSLEVYFDQCMLSPEGAEIFLDCSFGSIKLYVPRQWRVLDNMHATLGGVENDARRAQPVENAPPLTLTGNVQFGAIEIEYI